VLLSSFQLEFSPVEDSERAPVESAIAAVSPVDPVSPISSPVVLSSEPYPGGRWHSAVQLSSFTLLPSSHSSCPVQTWPSPQRAGEQATQASVLSAFPSSQSSSPTQM